MEKREKVEQGLKACTEVECPDSCPYKRDGDPDYCQHRLHRDAIELLDESPVVIVEQESTVDKIMKWSCVAIAWAMMIYFIAKVVF